MRFETEQDIYTRDLTVEDRQFIRRSVIVSMVEGEDLVSMRILPKNQEWLLWPAVAGELAVAMMTAAIGGASDFEADVVRANALNVLVGLQPDPTFVDYDRAAADTRATLTIERRGLERRMYGGITGGRSFAFPPVQNGITGSAHLARFNVEVACQPAEPDEAFTYCYIAVTAINRGGVGSSSMEMPPALAYDVASGLLAAWRNHAPAQSIDAMRRRIDTLCRTKNDPAPVEKVKGFYGAPMLGIRKARDSGADIAAERGALQADGLLDELLTAAPRR